MRTPLRRRESVGPNATLVDGDLEAFVRALKAEHQGGIEVAGPELAGSLAKLGLLDAYQLYLCPVASEQIGDMIKLTYVPA